MREESQEMTVEYLPLIVGLLCSFFSAVTLKISRKFAERGDRHHANIYFQIAALSVFSISLWWITFFFIALAFNDAAGFILLLIGLALGFVFSKKVSVVRIE